MYSAVTLGTGYSLSYLRDEFEKPVTTCEEQARRVDATVACPEVTTTGSKTSNRRATIVWRASTNSAAAGTWDQAPACHGAHAATRQRHLPRWS